MLFDPYQQSDLVDGQVIWIMTQNVACQKSANQLTNKNGHHFWQPLRYAGGGTGGRTPDKRIKSTTHNYLIIFITLRFVRIYLLVIAFYLKNRTYPEPFIT